MALTDVNVKELNNMNEAARRANLGNTIKDLQSGNGVRSGNYVLPNATLNKIGGVKQIEKQPDSSASSIEELVADFNSLLYKLKSAGIMP